MYMSMPGEKTECFTKFDCWQCLTLAYPLLYAYFTSFVMTLALLHDIGSMGAAVMNVWSLLLIMPGHKARISLTDKWIVFACIDDRQSIPSSLMVLCLCR